MSKCNNNETIYDTRGGDFTHLNDPGVQRFLSLTYKSGNHSTQPVQRRPRYGYSGVFILGNLFLWRV